MNSIAPSPTVRDKDEARPEIIEPRMRIQA